MDKRLSFRTAISVFACLATIDMAAAYYSPNQGRWLSRDPIGEEGGLNQHAFVENRPTNAVDPDGR